MRKIDFIDYAKMYAIITVVGYHYLQRYELDPLAELAANFGGTGIHLFFFLSGFGLNLKEVGSYKDFLKRKYVKIILPYYVFVALAFSLSFVTPLYDEFGLYAFLGHIFLFKMFDSEIIGSFGYHLWFISTLIQFYLFFPVLQLLFKKMGTLVFFLSCLTISFAYWIFLYQTELYHYRAYNSFFLQYIWEFGLGMVAAFLYLTRGFQFWKINMIRTLILAGVCLGAMGAITFSLGEAGKTFNDIPAFFAYAALAIAFYNILKKGFISLYRFFLRISKYSYSLYLVHFIIIQICFLLWQNTNLYFLPLHFLFYVAIVIICTELFYRITGFLDNHVIRKKTE